MVDSQFFPLYWKHVLYSSCTSLIWVLYFISTSLDSRLGFEPTLQLKGWNLRALQMKLIRGLQSWTLLPLLWLVAFSLSYEGTRSSINKNQCKDRWVVRHLGRGQKLSNIQCLVDKTMTMCESYLTKTYLKIFGASSWWCIGIAGCLRYNRGSFTRILGNLWLFGNVKCGGCIIETVTFVWFLATWKLGLKGGFIHGLGPAWAPARLMSFKPSIRPHFMNFFSGPTLSHVKWWDPIVGTDDLEG